MKSCDRWCDVIPWKNQHKSEHRGLFDQYEYHIILWGKEGHLCGTCYILQMMLLDPLLIEIRLHIWYIWGVKMENRCQKITLLRVRKTLVCPIIKKGSVKLRQYPYFFWFKNDTNFNQCNICKLLSLNCSQITTRWKRPHFFYFCSETRSLSPRIKSNTLELLQS